MAECLFIEGEQKISLLSGPKGPHFLEVASSLKGATKVVIAVAFARRSGWLLIWRHLRRAIRSGADVQIIVGTDFCQTDPYVLGRLLTLKRKFEIKSFAVRASAKTFHPKLFYFERDLDAHLIVGSANLTAGGLKLNAEVSLRYEGSSESLGNKVHAMVNEWEKHWQFIPIEEVDLADYKKKFLREKKKKQTDGRATKIRRAKVNGGTNPVGKRSSSRGNYSLHEKKLESIDLADRSREVAKRRKDRKGALVVLEQISRSKDPTKKKFMQRYNLLVGAKSHLWHSGLLAWGKSKVGNNRNAFKDLWKAIKQRDVGESDWAFFDKLLLKLKRVKGAGPNILTEMLHSADNRRFAVMNQNSVAGLAAANIKQYPPHPAKGNVNAQMLINFYRDMAFLRDAVGLKDFTETDWLLNRMFHD